MKRTKTKLVSSIVTLLVCFAMLVGSTFAWFTDTASTGVNTIKAGNLDIVLEYYDGDSWEPVTESTKLFKDDALWEPGHTEVAYLHIKNEGSLDLKYKMNVNVPSETGSINQKGEAFKLSDYLVFGKIDMASATSFYTTRDDARAAAGTTMGLSSWTKAGNLYANPIPTTVPAGSVNEEYIALVIYMPETVGNVANHQTGTAAPKIELGVNIVATQLNSESDSFGNDYDANADGNPDNGAAWTMAAFRAVADVPTNVSISGMTVTKYENDDETAAKLASVTIPATNSLTSSDKVVVSVKPESVPASVTSTLTADQVAFNYDIKLKKVDSSNNETDIASSTLPVTVELNVGKGLSGVKIYHTPAGGATTEVSGVSYDPITGLATFTTTSFSDYTVVYNAKATSTLPANAKVVMNLQELKDAINGMHDGDYVAFGANIVQDEVETSSGQITPIKASDAEGEVNATIDLNGYVFDGQIGGWVFSDTSGFNLNIIGTDKVSSEYYEHETGHHMVKAHAVNLYFNDALGTMTIKDGMFVCNNAVLANGNGNLVVDNGEFVAEDGIILSTYNKGTTIINGGKFITKANNSTFVELELNSRSNSYQDVIINDGTFVMESADCAGFVIDVTTGKEYGSITINGGNFTFAENTELVVALSWTGTNSGIVKESSLTNEEYKNYAKNSVTIKGGTFNLNPSEYVADGYHVVENSNNTWSVVVD